MKKILVIFLILVMIPMAIFTKGFSVGFGATASTGSTINGIVENKINDLKFENFSYGGYVNIKLFLVSVNGTVFPKIDSSDLIRFAGDLSVNLAVDISVVRVQAGLSANYFGSVESFRNWDFELEADNIKDIPLNVRAEVGLLLGDFNIGIWGLLPTGVTLNTFNDIFEIKDRWKNASLGIIVGVCF